MLGDTTLYILNILGIITIHKLGMPRFTTLLFYVDICHRLKPVDILPWSLMRHQGWLASKTTTCGGIGPMVRDTYRSLSCAYIANVACWLSYRDVFWQNSELLFFALNVSDLLVDSHRFPVHLIFGPHSYLTGHWSLVGSEPASIYHQAGTSARFLDIQTGMARGYGLFFCKSRPGNIHTYIHIHIYIYYHTSIYMYVYMYRYICMYILS